MSEKHKSTKNEMPHFSHFSQQKNWNYLFFWFSHERTKLWMKQKPICFCFWWEDFLTWYNKLDIIVVDHRNSNPFIFKPFFISLNGNFSTCIVSNFLMNLMVLLITTNFLISDDIVIIIHIFWYFFFWKITRN